MSVTLSDRALLEIKKVMQDQKISADENVISVGVAGSGCSGYQYRLAFSKRADIDSLNSTTFKFDGVEAVVDNNHLKYLDGVTVDFHEGLDRRGFVFNNPNAVKSSCCGGGGCSA